MALNRPSRPLPVCETQHNLRSDCAKVLEKEQGSRATRASRHTFIFYLVRGLACLKQFVSPFGHIPIS